MSEPLSTEELASAWQLNTTNFGARSDVQPLTADKLKAMCHCWCQNWNVGANGNGPDRFQEQCCWCGEWRDPPAHSWMYANTASTGEHGPHKRYFCGNPNHAQQAETIRELKDARDLAIHKIKQTIDGQYGAPGFYALFAALAALTSTEARGYEPCRMCADGGVDRWGNACNCEAWASTEAHRGAE